MKLFPVMGGRMIRSVPWDAIAPHAKQAIENHGQTLEKLASRGGLGATEMMAVLEDRRFNTQLDGARDGEESERWLVGYVAGWLVL